MKLYFQYTTTLAGSAGECLKKCHHNDDKCQHLRKEKQNLPSPAKQII